MNTYGEISPEHSQESIGIDLHDLLPSMASANEDRQGHNSAQGDRFNVTDLQPIDAFIIEIPNSAFANKLV